MMARPARDAMMFTTLLKIRALPASDILLLCEALVVLAGASLAIAVLPFSMVGDMASRGGRTMPLDEAVLMKRIRWAVLTCAKRVPWRAVCFQQGLAAQLMLRRRGINSILYYGAALDDASGLAAHVWVRCGEMDVIGGEAATRFGVLAQFPRPLGRS